MNSRIFDKNGIEIKEGDNVRLPYIDPGGNVHLNQGSIVKTIFKYGCFGYESKTRFVPFLEFLDYENGDYVPNAGNRRVYIEDFPLYVTTDPVHWDD